MCKHSIMLMMTQSLGALCYDDGHMEHGTGPPLGPFKLQKIIRRPDSVIGCFTKIQADLYWENIIMVIT